MTTTEYLQREICRAELSIRRAERKPNTPPEELRGLHEKLEHLQVALEAVAGDGRGASMVGRWQRKLLGLIWLRAGALRGKGGKPIINQPAADRRTA